MTTTITDRTTGAAAPPARPPQRCLDCAAAIDRRSTRCRTCARAVIARTQFTAGAAGTGRRAALRLAALYRRLRAAAGLPTRPTIRRKIRNNAQ